MVLKDWTEIWINGDLLVMLTVGILFNLFYMFILTAVRRYNEETKFPVTPSFVLTRSSDSGIGHFITHILTAV